MPEFRAFLCERLAGEMAAAAAEDALEIDALVTPGARGAAAARGVPARWRRSARAIPSRCSPWPTCGSSGRRPMRGGHMRCALVGAGGAAVEGGRLARRRHPARPAPVAGGGAAARRRQAASRTTGTAATGVAAGDRGPRRSAHARLSAAAAAGAACVALGSRIYPPLLATEVPSSIG